MSDKRYVAIIWRGIGIAPTMIGIIDRKLINLKLDNKIHKEYQTMWLDMCPISLNRTFNIQVKENQLIDRTF